MITPKPLASAMMVPTRQVTLPTSAGHSVRFASGIAVITDTNDLPYLMGRADVKLMVTPYAMSWMGEVFEKTRKINADVQWPPNWEVSHTSEREWLIRPLEPASPQQGDAIDEAIKGKPRWQKPPAN